MRRFLSNASSSTSVVDAPPPSLSVSTLTESNSSSLDTTGLSTPTASSFAGAQSQSGSATKRALQQFGQSAFSNINGVVRKASAGFPALASSSSSHASAQYHSEADTTSVHSDRSDSLAVPQRNATAHPSDPRTAAAAGASPNLPPPTPPSKSPYMANDDAANSMDDWDELQLPFGGQSRASSSAVSLSSSQRSPPPPLVAVEQSAYSINASTLVDTKDDMMMELLSSDALLHVGQFEILGFDEVEELRKERSILSNRLSILENKLVVETRIRDAAVSLSKLYTSKRMSRQADESVDAANRKVEAVTNELNKIAKREADVRTRILRHMAAVLGMMLRRVEGTAYGLSTGQSQSPQLSLSQSSAGKRRSPSSDESALLTPKSISSGIFANLLANPDSLAASGMARSGSAASRFEGPHLFAGNKNATIPHSRSPFTSPQLQSSQSSFGTASHSFVPTAPSPALSSSTAVLPYVGSAHLEERIQALTQDLEATQRQLDERTSMLDSVTAERDQLLRDLQDSEDNAELQQRRQEDAHLSRSRQLEEELESVRDQLKKAKQDQESIARSSEANVEQIQRDLERHRSQRHRLDEVVRQTLEKHAGQNAPLARFLPRAEHVQEIDSERFIEEHLDDLLSQAGKAYSDQLQDHQDIQRQMHEHQQSSSQQSKKSEADVLAMKKQIDDLQHEKQSLSRSLSQASREKAGLDRALRDLQQDFDDHSNLAVAKQREEQEKLARQLEMSERSLSQRSQDMEEERRTFRGRLENLQGDLEEIRKSRVEMVQTLQRIWQILPTQSALETRAALKDTDEIAKFQAAFSASRTSSGQPADRQSFSPTIILERIEYLVQGEQRLLSRLLASAENATTHKSATERAQKLLQESKASLQTYAKQVRELENRLEHASKKEVQMLERVNDAQAALEQARIAMKKAETQASALQGRCSTLEAEKRQLESKMNEVDTLRKQVDDAKEDLALAQDELDELRNKEAKQRVQFLEELTNATEEASSLRTQLRTAQRKLAQFTKPA